MKKINIIQFMPYFPPHKGGLETVGEEISKYWIKSNYGNFINVTTHYNQDGYLNDNNIEKVIFYDEVIGYKKDGYIVLVAPSIELIYNFPVFNIWSKKYKLIKKYLKLELLNLEKDFRVITHTRFFLTSFIGGLFARRNNIKWIHIEHGSDYVKLSSKFKSSLSYLYDKIIGKWIFKKADIVLAISEACKFFIQNKFINREVQVFYRGVDLGKININKFGDLKIVFVGRLVNLKGVNYLINSYRNTGIKNELIIIGDGEERLNLENISKGLNISFIGFKNRDFIIDYFSKNNCILVNPSFQEGLPTTVIEGLLLGCPVLASDVGGTKEISNKNDLILFEAGDLKSLEEKLINILDNYDNLKGLSFDEVNKKFSWENNIKNLYNLIK